jgi:hypothetical protein
MADSKQAPEPAARAAPQPYGPGLMLIFGVGLLALAYWFGRDFFDPPEAWVKEGRNVTIWINGGVMVAGVGGAIYCFIMAARRSKKAAEGASGGSTAPADAPKPPDVGA